MLVSYKAFVGWGRKKFFKRIGVISKPEGGGGKEGKEGTTCSSPINYLSSYLRNLWVGSSLCEIY